MRGHLLRFAPNALAVFIAAVFLAACASNGSQVAPAGPMQQSAAGPSLSTKGALNTIGPLSEHATRFIDSAAGLGRADAATFGIYVAQPVTNVVYGYPFHDRSNDAPVCSVGPFNDLRYSDIAVDRNGDLFVVDAGANTVTVFQGPGLCGPKLGSITNPFGTFTDVASRDGVTIVAGYYGFHPDRGGVAICTLSAGCTHHLDVGSGGPGLVYSVAVAPNGDCWASAQSAKYSNFLVYFPHCRHNGVRATGTENAEFGLDIDANGNLVATTFAFNPYVLVYSGCNPACTLVGGPFPLMGAEAFAFYGHLNGRSNKLIVPEGNISYGKLDVYSYSPSAVTYLYSITNGLSQGVVTAAAFSPNSKE
jgi:hypothetical protein